MITTLVVSSVAAAALAGWWYARESTPVGGPIVLISVDGFRHVRLRETTNTTLAPSSTPSIDALAADAVVFDRAYTHSPLTLPAHASLLAGQLPFEHGVRDEAGFALRDDARSMAELLQNRGFETGAAVSSCSGRSRAWRKDSRSSTPNCRMPLTRRSRRSNAMAWKRLTPPPAGFGRGVAVDFFCSSRSTNEAPNLR
jgi:hypothetical protein